MPSKNLKKTNIDFTRNHITSLVLQETEPLTVWQLLNGSVTKGMTITIHGRFQCISYSRFVKDKALYQCPICDQLSSKCIRESTLMGAFLKSTLFNQKDISKVITGPNNLDYLLQSRANARLWPRVIQSVDRIQQKKQRYAAVFVLQFDLVTVMADSVNAG
ncbi:hypothetical protein ROZALSC1DRAFT_23477 [Rozella allomycis CSF55]|uniref:Uncharacterized protein n=1 Tax=Rozella allomycis (strain CSF55) TaxID=988480 RepID=A0A4P9YFZ4_ROZAC|nr:hypothetical protein ROZALSC1DRAFT_23477 [Rozella allomycis CSF55]